MCAMAAPPPDTGVSERRGLRLGSVGGMLFFAEVGRGDAGVEAAGGKPQQGGG